VAGTTLHGLVLVDGAQPDCRGAELLDVVEPAQQALQVAAVIETGIAGIEAALQSIRRQAAEVVPDIAAIEAIGQQKADHFILWQAVAVVQRERTLPQRQRNKRCRPWQTLD